MVSSPNPREKTQKTQRSVIRLARFAMTVVGLVLLLAVGSFYAFGFYSSSQLDNLNASIDGPLTLPEDTSSLTAKRYSGNFSNGSPDKRQQPDKQQQPEIILPDNSVLHGALLPNGSFKPVEVVKDISSFTPIKDAAGADNINTLAQDTVSTGNELSDIGQTGTSPTSSTATTLTESQIAGYGSINPGQQFHPKYWGQPLWAGTDTFSYRETDKPDGFQAISADQAAGFGTLSVAKRIRVPSIGVDSVIEPLAIIGEGEDRRYESPVNVIGSIPGTANPGEAGNGWFFGHLESPLKGEGNVFNRLPEIPEKITAGDPIYVSVETDDAEFLYQIVSSRVVYQDELQLYDTNDSTITLVTCSRRPFYDYRQIVTAKLVGVKSLGGNG